ncbi:hypothetical protein [Swaminathania salitolerans]|uniref:Uncharacterized protein n=1 Tax=Swaminathania salitolerans TaxID=182838 RepID=A0A511BL97_9PROT|nr:hypothetical protein [Swaminathania salitolerans]GBQ09747.1 hypothetical protein AA21291_0181 [Swaminathania salitolerans LMG 21291]GEL00862.1 hypothetical protein SSA02_00250 [Swaminathania salitolerans]
MSDRRRDRSGPVSSAPLSEDEKTELRRFCGYAALGDAATGESSWRFFQSAGVLEWRLRTLSEAENKRIRSLLKTVLQMEQAVISASESLDTQAVSVWTRNSREMAERTNLFTWWRRRLCGFLGVAPGPDLQEQASILI